jgi:magnesium-transporting ATPase (P-type)
MTPGAEEKGAAEEKENGAEKRNSKHPSVVDDDEKEEARDTVTSLYHPMRVKVNSDVTGMMGGQARPPKGRRKKTVSDISGMYAAEKYAPPKTKTGGKEGRRRTKSSTDVITKFGTAPVLQYDDLKLAEHVAAYGDATERLRSGSITEADFEEVMQEKEEFEEAFEFNHEGLTSAEAAIRLAKYGRNEITEKVTPKWLLFLSQFWAPMPIMIWIAIIIELGIQNYLDMGILLFIQFANASISFYESNKAGNAIAALKGSLKPSATCKRDGAWKVMDAAEIVPGDTVMLGSGSAIPADCRVNDSEIDVDQAALTGESLPVTFYKGDSCKMGSTVVRGEVEVREKEINEWNGIHTILEDLVQDSSPFSHFFSWIYFCSILLLLTSSVFLGNCRVYRCRHVLWKNGQFVARIARTHASPKDAHEDHVCVGWLVRHVVLDLLYLPHAVRCPSHGSSLADRCTTRR